MKSHLNRLINLKWSDMVALFGTIWLLVVLDYVFSTISNFFSSGGYTMEHFWDAIGYVWSIMILVLLAMEIGANFANLRKIAP